MAGRPRVASDDAIMTATAKAVSAAGPSRLTMADVAREAGVSPAALTQRFGSKRQLLLAFTARAADDLTASLNAYAASGSPVRALVNQLVGVASGISSADELSRHLAFLQLELSDPEFLQHTQRYTETLRVYVGDLLDEAVAAGELSGIDSQQLARSVVVIYNGSLITWAITREGDLTAFLRHELEQLLTPKQPPRNPALPLRTAAHMGDT